MRTFRSPDRRAGPGDDHASWTKQELLDTSGLSSKTFDTIRKAARVKGPTHGGLTHAFGAPELISLIRRAESGSFTERGGPAARAWRTLLSEAGIPFPE